MKNGPAQEFRFVHLDLVRGIAALLVCMQHLRHVDFIDYGQLQTAPSQPNKVFYLLTGQGHNAVMIFFVLSGFFVAGSVATDFEKKRWSWVRFAIRRLSRLYVVLIPALVLTLFWDGLGRWFSPGGDFGEHGIATFGASLLFLQGIFTQAYGTNSPLWSVAYEFWYYLMFPLLFCGLARSLSNTGRVASMLLFLICVVILPQKVLTGGLIWLMGYGAFALFRYKSFSNYASSSGVFFVGVVSLTLSVYLAGTPHGAAPGDFTIITHRDLLTGLSFSLMVPFLARHQPGVVWYRAVSVGLSDISYTLYAVHFPVVMFLSCTLIRNKDAMPSATSYAFFAGYLALILIYATAVWWLFESRTGQVRKFLEEKLL